MKPDDELCLCFHVTRRKVTQYIRVEKPAVASQLSGCFGAGTGCGWCRPYLERLFESERASAQTHDSASIGAEELPSAADYAKSRAVYRRNRQSPQSAP